MEKRNKVDKIKYKRSVKPRWRKPKWDEKPIELYGLSTTTSLLIKNFKELKDRKGLRAMLKSVRPEYTIEQFYKGILEIIKKNTGLDHINKNHSGFFNVMVEMHRHFRKYLDFDDDLRAKYADKLLEIYEEYENEHAPDNMEITKEDLEILYLEKGYSTVHIGHLYQCSYATILNRMKQYNIPRRPKGSQSPLQHPVTLDDQKDLITKII